LSSCGKHNCSGDWGSNVFPMSANYPVFFSILSFILLSSCGKKTNIIGLTVPASHRSAFDASLSSAESSYDANDLDKAMGYAETAYSLDPNSEEAAILLGYIYLGKAGIGPFQLAAKMLDKGEKEKSASESESGAELLAEGSSNSEALGSLKDVVGLTDAEFSLMGEVDEVDPDLPVIVPVCAGEARRAVEKLELINKAILVTCPFVDVEVRLDEDFRHDCEQTSANIQNKAGSHFLWAFTHLTEALAFYSVLTYSTDSESSKSNLELRVAKVKEIDVTDPSQLGGFLTLVKSLEQTVSKVMPVGGSCSEEYPQTQLVGLVNDMIAVSAAFGRMAGIPESITKSVTDAMAKIEKIRSQSNETALGDEQNKAFKGDLTKNIGKTLGSKIDELQANGQTFDAAQTASVCNAYGSITGDQEDADNKPSICQ